MASVDGGPDIRYNTDGFDTNAPSSSVQYISLTFPTAPATSLAPHTIRLTSLPVTPLSFEGVLIQNTQLSNSQLWSEAQRLRPYLEFIGEGFDGERPGGFFRDDDTWRSVAGAAREDPSDAPFSTTQYALGERLGIRHSHYVTNTCIASDCDTRKLPGLGKQYFHASPDDYLMRTPHVLEPADPRHHSNVHAAWRFSESNTPSHVIVDTGILDILHNKMSRDDYTHFLAVFLARLRSQAHPNATIMVVARKGPPNDDDTVFNSDFTTSSYRESLYSATLRAVEKLRDPRTVLVPVKLADVDLQTAYLRGLCPHLVGTGSKSVGRACANAMASQSLVGKRTVMTVLVLVLVVGMLWILRAKLLGALATVLGSKRLGMQEEEGLLNTAASASGGK